MSERWRALLTAVPNGVRISILVQPRARRTEVIGPHGFALRVRVAAPPADGNANAALTVFLASRLGVAPGNVRIVSGRTGRRKVVEAEGVNVQEAAQRLGIGKSGLSLL